MKLVLLACIAVPACAEFRSSDRHAHVNFDGGLEAQGGDYPGNAFSVSRAQASQQTSQPISQPKRQLTTQPEIESVDIVFSGVVVGSVDVDCSGTDGQTLVDLRKVCTVDDIRWSVR